MSVQRYLKLKPLAAMRRLVRDSNPGLTTDSFTVESIVDLGIAAHPNTTAVIAGDGVYCSGKTTVAFDRLNPGNVFGRLQGVVKRPAVRVLGYDDNGGAKTATIASLAEAIQRCLGLDLDTVSANKDLDGSQTVALPATGGYVDYDITVNSANSLRFRPSTTDKIPVRFYADGKRWQNDARYQDCRASIPNLPDEFEKGLILYMPLGADASSAFRGQNTTVTFNSTAAYTLAGKASANASNITLAQSEITKKASTQLLMPLAGNLVDQVSGNTMASQGTVTFPAAGRNNVSMLFTSTNARVNLSNSAALQQLLSGQNDWTIAFDFYGVSTNYYQQIVGCYSGTNGAASDSMIVVYYKGQLYTYGLSGTTAVNSVAVTGLDDSKWHRIEVNRSAGKLRLFVDGVKVAEKDLTVNLNLATTPFQIGNSNNLGNPCQCYIRALEVHNVALHTVDHTPDWWWADAALTTNTVSMVGKEIATSTWKQIWSITPTVTESAKGYLKWMLVVGGTYCKWDAVTNRPIASTIDRIVTDGYTTAQLQTLMAELPVKGINTLGLVVALVTDGTAAPVITSLLLNYVIAAGTATTYGWTAPVPNSACKLRDGIGTQFSFGGYTLGRDLTNSKVDLDAQLQGSSDFTIEVDIQRSTLAQSSTGSTDDTIIWNCYNGTGQTEGTWMGIHMDGTLAVGQFDTSATYRGFLTTMAITDLLPHKLEYVKKSNVLYAFVDGVLGGSLTMPTAGYQGSANFNLGFGRTVHGNTSNLTRPFRGYMRDFKVYNYARFTDTHVINTGRKPLAGIAALNNGANRPISNPKKSLQALLYGVDFTAVFDSVGLSAITSASTSTVLQGAIVTAIKAKLATLGISAIIPAGLTLTDTTVSNLYGVSPNAAAGHNANMARVVNISAESFLGDNTTEVDGIVTLHLKTVPTK